MIRWCYSQKLDAGVTDLHDLRTVEWIAPIVGIQKTAIANPLKLQTDRLKSDARVMDHTLTKGLNTGYSFEVR
jgi:hypothetical protein